MQTPFSPSSPRSVFGNYNAAAESLPGEHETVLESMGSRAAPSEELPLQTRIDRAVARSYLHRFIARCYEYPTAAAWEWLRAEETQQALRSASAILQAGGTDSAIAGFLAEVGGATFDQFLTAHLTSFGHAARGPNPMNEIEYGELKADPLFQPHRLADLAAFYRAFGLEVTEDASERQDHICLELEFMSVLGAKEAFALEHQDEDALAILAPAQKQFLREHLGRWIPAFARRLARSAGPGVIAAVADLTRQFITDECSRFGVNPGSEELVLRPIDDTAESVCSSCGITELPPGALTAA